MVGSSEPERFNTVPRATGGITRLACARLYECKKDVAAILSRAGMALAAVQDPSARLEADAQIRVLEIAAQELGDDYFGFNLARSFDVRAIGLVYYVMASSERLSDALLNAERYSQIVNEGVRLRVTLNGGATVALDYVDLERQLDRHHIEFWIVALVRMCREVTSSRLALSRLRVRHRRANPSDSFKSFFGTEIEFGANADEIVFSAPVAALPAFQHDSYLNRLLRRYADRALACRTARAANLRLEVERIASELLPHGNASAAAVARKLGISSRSLSRRLRAEGVTFSTVLDELRQALAETYLEERELSISEIAWLLGYEEVSSLTHAFRRWTGVTPRQFRQNQATIQTHEA
jgi:AraC-like DNA-binding protein